MKYAGQDHDNSAKFSGLECFIKPNSKPNLNLVVFCRAPEKATTLLAGASVTDLKFHRNFILHMAKTRILLLK